MRQVLHVDARAQILYLFRNELFGLIALNVLAEIKPRVPSERKTLQKSSAPCAKLGAGPTGQALGGLCAWACVHVCELHQHRSALSM